MLACGLLSMMTEPTKHGEPDGVQEQSYTLSEWTSCLFENTWAVLDVLLSGPCPGQVNSTRVETTEFWSGSVLQVKTTNTNEACRLPGNLLGTWACYLQSQYAKLYSSFHSKYSAPKTNR